jgi:hypothetical protein
LLQNCCITNAIEQGLLQPSDSAVGAAALVKKDAAAAAARRAAIRYLGTVDCNWWPEAEAALINALLKDRNECVRLEAALALQRGCCCNARIIKALTTSVSGTGIPPEDSDCVKAAAYLALSRCCMAVEPVPVEPPIGPKKEDEGIKKVKLDYVEYYGRAKPAPQPDFVQQAKRVLAEAATATDPSTGNVGMPAVASRPGSVSQIISTAFGASPRHAGIETGEFMPQSAVAGPETPTGIFGTTVTRPALSAAAPGTVSTYTAPQQAASGGRERPPFFDALTRALRGKQFGHPPEMAPEVIATDKAAPSTGVAVARPGIAPAVEESLEGHAETSAQPVIGPGEEHMPVEMPTSPSMPK